MLKPFVQLTMGGVVALLLWKVAMAVLLPLLGLAAGVLLLAFKMLLLAVIVLAVWLVFRNLSRRSDGAA